MSSGASRAPQNTLGALCGAGAGAGLLPASVLLAAPAPLPPALLPPAPLLAVALPLVLLPPPSPPDMLAPGPAAKPKAEAPPVVVLASAWPCSNVEVVVRCHQRQLFLTHCHSMLEGECHSEGLPATVEHDTYQIRWWCCEWRAIDVGLVQAATVVVLWGTQQRQSALRPQQNGSPKHWRL